MAPKKADAPKAAAKAEPKKADAKKADAKKAPAKAPAKAAAPAAKAAAAPAKVAAKVAAKAGGKVTKTGGKAAGKAAGKAGAKAGAKVAGKKGGKVAPKAVRKRVNKREMFKPLFEKRPRNFGIGQDIPPKREVTRFVRWPKYVVLQRQKRVLERRLKVPPTLNQFRKTLDTHTKNELFKFAAKYKPEGRKEKKKRLRGAASKAAAATKKDAKKAADTSAAQKKRPEIKFGIQRVTRLIESGRAKLVVIAHDVDPIEITLWLPTLCHKLDIPYCIVKGKAALGRLVGMKTATCLAFTTVRSDDGSRFNKLLDSIRATFNDKYDETRRHWGGMQMGRRSKVKMGPSAS